MGIVRLSGQLHCANADDATVVATHVPLHIALTLAEPGCLSFAVVQTADPLVWQVDESFTDDAAFAAHQTRTKASDWARLTAHIERRFTIA
jgi:quinol monooxygenase YgiN